VTKGSAYAPVRVKKSADLTKEMLDSGDWKTATFKPYNYMTLGEKVGGGYLHPLLKVCLMIAWDDSDELSVYLLVFPICNNRSARSFATF